MKHHTGHGVSSHPGAGQRTRSVAPAAWLGTLGALGAVTFLGTLLAVHLADSGPSPVRDYVSDYANGPAGEVFTAGLVAHALGNVALAFGIWLTLPPSGAGRWGAVLVGLAAVGLLVAGVYPTDAPGLVSTTAGTVHRSAVMVSFPLEVLGLTLLARGYGQSPGWQGYGRRTLLSAILAAVALLWLVVAVRAGWPSGLAERAALLVLLYWELSTSIRLAARTSRPVPPTSGPERDYTG